MNGNLMIDYLNGLSDRPFLAKQALRPDLEVIHRSEEHRRIYTTDIIQQRARDGFDETDRRGYVEHLSGNRRNASPAASDAERRDDTLDAGFQRRAVPIGPVPATPARQDAETLDAERTRTGPEPKPRPKSFLDGIIDRLSEGAIERDDARMRAAVQDYERSPMGRQWRQDVAEFAQALDFQERQQALEAQQRDLLAQQQNQARQGPAMQM